MKKEIIGTDASLDICKNEGYHMMETEGDFKQEKEYRVFCYWPLYAINKGEEPGLRTDTVISWQELKTKYEIHKKEIDYFSDDMTEIMGLKNPGYYDFLNAASTIDGYCGLD